MAGELLAMRRAAVGAPIADYARLVDRARINKGGRGSGLQQAADTSTSTTGATITASATPHEKGVWASVLTASSFRAETIIVCLAGGTGANGVATSALLDIGYGPDADNVTTIVANLNVGYSHSTALGGMFVTFVLPYDLASGSQLWARLQGIVVSETVIVSVQLREAGTNAAAPTAITTYGANTATSNGVTLTNPASANTKPAAYDTITASTTADHRYLLVSASAASEVAGTLFASTGLVDIAIGAASSEVVIMGNLPFSTTTNEIIAVAPAYWAIPLTRAIPSGTRISARYQSTSNSTAARISIIAHGFN